MGVGDGTARVCWVDLVGAGDGVGGMAMVNGAGAVGMGAEVVGVWRGGGWDGGRGGSGGRGRHRKCGGCGQLGRGRRYGCRSVMRGIDGWVGCMMGKFLDRPVGGNGCKDGY